MRKIKWENIFAIIYGGFAIYQLYTHIQLNGLYNGLIIEMVINVIAVVGVHYIIKDIRKNKTNWLWEE